MKDELRIGILSRSKDMSRKFSDLKASDLAKLPALTYDHFALGKREFICTFLTKRICTGIWQSMAA